MSDYPQFLLKQLDEDRTSKDSLCDFFLRASKRNYPVHKCIIGVTSNFFKKRFHVVVDKSNNFFEFPSNIATKAVELVIDYAYGNNLVLNSENAYQLLEVAAYLEIAHLQHYCIQYLLNNLSLECALKTWKYANKYDNNNFLAKCESFVANNLQVLLGEKRYLFFDIESFKRFINMKVNLNMQETMYECIMNWINYDKKDRRKYFKDLYQLIDVDKLSDPFYNFVVLPEKMRSCGNEKKSEMQSEDDSKAFQSVNTDKIFKNDKLHKLAIPYLNERHHYLSADLIQKRSKVLNLIRKSLRATPRSLRFQEPKFSKKNISSKPISTSLRVVLNADEFIVVGGQSSPCSVKKFNILTKNWTIYPNLENRTCVDVGLAFAHRALFVIGGRSKDYLQAFNHMHSVEFKGLVHESKEVACMKWRRYKFGCAVLDHKLFVAGGFSVRSEALDTVECYSIGRNEWEEKTSLSFKRGGCSLVEAGGLLYAIGGRDNKSEYHRSVETFNGTQWKMCLPMIVRRSDLAAVFLNGNLYAIGGKSNANCYNGSVERRDPGSWKYVARLNIPRSGHSACVLDGKIYVLGGVNGHGPVNSMEVYDPAKNTWEIFGELIGDPIGATMISTGVHLYN